MSEYMPSVDDLRQAWVTATVYSEHMLTQSNAEFDRAVAKIEAEALREAARYFEGGLHCADMRTTPEETVRDLYRRAVRIEEDSNE